MSTFEKIAGGKVLYTDDKGRKHAFNASDRILSAAFNNTDIFISSATIVNSKVHGFALNWNDVTVPSAASREELVTELATNFFDESGGGVTIVGDDAGLAKESKQGRLDVVNGKFAGTFFGDDFTVTQRTAKLATKWSSGLPVFVAKTTFVDTGKWAILNDPNAPAFPDGVCYFETGATANGKCFVTTDENNRYQPGHLSYFGYTVAFNGVELAESNGDYIALVGAFVRGAVSAGQRDQIKECIAWGYVRENNVVSKKLIIYKNFEKVLEKDLDEQNTLDWSNLQIVEQQIGYYGIHPSILYVFDQEKKENTLLDYTKFSQQVTSVSNPDFSLGVYVENLGNTSNIRVLNGSAEFGNYTEREEVADASARNVPDSISIGSIVVDPDDTDGSGFVAAYRVTDIFNAIDSVSGSGVTRRNFQSNIQNQLIALSVAGDASSAVNLNVWFIPASDVTATFSNVISDVSVLQKANSAAVDFTNAIKVFSQQVTIGGGGPISGFGSSSEVLEGLKLLLKVGTVAVLTLQSVSATTLSDFRVDLITRDLF